MHHARVSVLVLSLAVFFDPTLVHADAPSLSGAASEARGLAAPFSEAPHAETPHAESEEPAPPADRQVFDGATGLELSLGLGSASALSVGVVIAPELAIDLVLEGFLAQLDGVTLGVATVGVAFQVSFTRPHVGDVIPIAELLLGASVPAIVPAGWQARPRAFGSLGVGVGYVLDRGLALRASVGPTLAFDDLVLVVGVTGHLAVVARV